MNHLQAVYNRVFNQAHNNHKYTVVRYLTYSRLKNSQTGLLGYYLD
jgi:hypothetical protein